MSITNLIGQVSFVGNLNPIPHVKVEIWQMDSTSDGNAGVLISVMTDAEGKFNVDIIGSIAEGTSLLFKVFKGHSFIYELPLSYGGEGSIMQIEVPAEVYDQKVVDNIVEGDDINYMLVSGVLSGVEGLVIKNATINVYESGFRTRTLLASTKTDQFGYYISRINVRSIVNTKVINTNTAGRSILVEAVSPDGTSIGISGSNAFRGNTLTIDVVADDESSYAGLTVTKFEHLVSQINYITNGADISTITGYANGDKEVEVVGNAIGKNSKEISEVVNAYRYALELPMNIPHLMYPLVVGDVSDINPVRKYNFEEVRTLIKEGMESNLIPDTDEGIIESFIGGVKDHQVALTVQIPIEGEDFNLEAVLLPGFEGDTVQLNLFLHMYNEYQNRPVNEFWENYELEVGEDAALRVRKCLQLSSITGSQPEIIGNLLAEVSDYADLSELSTWTENDWINRLNDINNNADRICVPAVIKDATGGDSVLAIKEFAGTLKDLFQNLYPLTNIRSRIQAGEAGIIDDTTARDEAIIFISNNSDFDLRLSTVHDITPENCNLDGITRLEDLKEGLAPLQRLMRVAGGNPEAIIAMKKGDLQSAGDVADISKDEFADTYQDAFGSREIAIEAHNTAVMIQTVAASTATYIGTASHPAVNQIPVLPNYAVSLSELTTSNISAASFVAKTASFNILSGTGRSYCTCRECLSLYSPAAYFTDLMNFVRKRTQSRRTTSNNDGYLELTRRRPDLLHIDLSCKNTNTAVPYVDLVNELLETHILRQEGRPNIPDSYQTEGGAPVLAAHPEHIVKQNGTYVDSSTFEYVYDEVLPQAIYPFSLPFSLPLEQTRVYFDHLGYSRYDLIKSFRGYNNVETTPSYDKISDYLIYAEYFGISYQEAKIITDHNESEPWKCYGVKAATVNASNGIPDPLGYVPLLTGNWNSLLTGRLDVLLQQTGIEYLDLLHFLQTDILNLPNSLGEREIYVTNISGFDAETCELNELKLEFTGAAGSDIIFLKKFYRFIRLWRAYKLSVNEWDVVFRALNITEISNIDNSSTSEFQRLGRVLALSDRLKINPLMLATWWNNIDTHRYTNFNSELLIQSTSVYDKVFRDRSVINLPLEIFKDLSGVPTGTLPGPNTLPSEYEKYASILASCCGIEEAALFQLLQYLEIDPLSAVNITALSRVYALAQLSKALKLSVKDFIKALQLIIPEVHLNTVAINPTDADVTDSIALLELILERITFISGSKFSLDELYYLVTNTDTTGGSLVPNSKNIQIFFEDIRASLKAEPIYVRPVDENELDPNADLKQKLENIVYEKFTKEFAISREMLNLVFPDLITTSGDEDGLFYDLISESFVISTLSLTPDAEIPGSDMPVIEFYEQYYYVAKVFSIVLRWGLNYEEFKYLYQDSTKSTVGMDFQALPFKSTPAVSTIWPLLEGVLMADHWMQLKRALNLVDNGLVSVWISIKSERKDDFVLLLNRNNSWPENILTDLIGASDITGASGKLNVRFPENFAANELSTVTLLNKVLIIISRTGIIGLNVTSMHNVLVSSPALTISESRKVLLAAKSKYNESAWLKIAKPLRDELRNKQRKALTDYIITSTKPVSGQNWRTANDVYAWFLVDVEMEPCTMTSRLRLAISSVQLFMDRILLGIERYFTATPAPVYYEMEVKQGYVQQWEAWRKWYRIWEANRKVFLYPENWVEPELRDNKSVFFKELEARLLEDEVNMDNVTDAVKDYLLKLNDVARLEPVGNYYEQRTVDKKDRSVVHAFARTYGKPNRYYYRRLEFNEWTPWERIEIDIKSEHVVPYVWNGRLHLFWITTRVVRINARKDYMDWIYQKPSKNNEFFHNDTNSLIGHSDMPGNDPKYSTEQLEITLNWSEYRNGRWLDQKIGSDKMLISMFKFVSEKLSENFRNAFYRQLTKNKDLTLAEFMASRLFMYIHYNKQGGYLQAMINFPKDMHNIANDNAFYLHSFIFPDDSNADCRVMKDFYLKWNQPAPAGTLFSNQKFMQKTGITKLFYNNYNSLTSFNFYVYESEKTDAAKGLSLDKSVDIFKKVVALGNYKITSGSAYRELATNYSNPMGDRFFFEDSKNVYYAHKTKFQTHYSSLIAPTQTPFDRYPVNFTFPLLSQVTVGTPNFGKYITGPVTPLLPVAEKNANIPSNQQAVVVGPSFNTPVLMAASPVQQQAASGPFSKSSGTMVSAPVPVDVYKFITFYHPQVKQFFALLNGKGMDALMDIRTQTITDTMEFFNTYDPTTRVESGVLRSAYPKDIVYFDYKEAYACYNWELFYHIPMLVAQRLHDDQKFAEARKWYHYIFDPTCNVDDTGTYTSLNKRFWRFRDFYDNFDNVTTVQELLNAIAANNTLAIEQVAKWENNPFQPHVLARMRRGVYMQNTLMKYLDNLIDWGDMLFKRDTIESLNEATQLYILAANLLGPKPKELPQRAYSEPHSYQELLDTTTMDEFSNAMVQIETLIDNNLVLNASSSAPSNSATFRMAYFCLTANDKLLSYWDTVADRLFKIRNCMNIDGVVRQLPLFDPPIDPAMLVKAAAAGVDMGSVLNDISSANQPVYRYSAYVQKANELCGDLKALGSSMLAALEKKDAEQLSLIRSAQELSVLEAIKQVRQLQIEEATAGLEALELTKINTEYRLEYYVSREYTNKKESKNLQLNQESAILQFAQSDLNSVASVLSLVPEFNATAPFSIGPTFGGISLASMMSLTSAKMGSIAAFKSAEAVRAATLGGFDRRMDDWQFQAESARKEIAQLDKQIVAAQIRISIAEKELENQELQIKNTQATDAFMRSKFSNQELYSWMIGQISTTYFQSYQIAYDIAKRTEKAYNNELAFAKPPAAGYIQFGYWDSLKKGLMAGEKLQLDIRKMEAAYLENNKRELELSKDVSLLFLHPEALMDLKETGTCNFSLPSWIFELDYPTHCFRRIKSVSISIPCVSGPYTNVSGQLTLENPNGCMVLAPDGTLKNVKGSPTYSIATSKAQNDSGLFEPNLRDERYLPFEGYGLDGDGTSWILEMMKDVELRQFDYATINDVIIHINYTAQPNLNPAIGNNIKTELKNRLKGLFKESEDPDTYFRLPCYFSLAHQFSNEYFNAFQQLVPVPISGGTVNAGRLFNLPLFNSLFPAFCENRQIIIDQLQFALAPKATGAVYQLVVNNDDANPVVFNAGNNYQNSCKPVADIELNADDTVTPLLLNLYKMDGSTLVAVSEEELKDVFMVCKYKLV